MPKKLHTKLKKEAKKKFPSSEIKQNIFSWQKNHCKSAYDNDLKWAKSYIEQDKEVSSRTE